MRKATEALASGKECLVVYTCKGDSVYMTIDGETVINDIEDVIKSRRNKHTRHIESPLTHHIVGVAERYQVVFKFTLGKNTYSEEAGPC